MTRVRSPNYPALSLPEAITAVGKVFVKEHTHRAAKDVVAKDLGYGSLNGASLGTISALVKYGLLTQFKEGDYRVSEQAMAILHPHSPQEKAEAITSAARQPALFAEMLSDFPGSIPSDDNLRSYLVRRGFAPGALPGVISAYRETMALVGEVGGTYDSPPDDDVAFDMSDPAAAEMYRTNPSAFTEPKPAPRIAPGLAVPAPGSDPYRVSFTPTGGLEIVGRLTTLEEVEQVIRQLNVWKCLFEPVESIQRPKNWNDDDQDASR